jgi:hypothetical protein
MSFAGDIHKFTIKTNLAADKVLRGTVLGLFGNIIQRTPVDTGRLRSNWQVSIGSYPAETVTQTPAIAVTKGNAEIGKAQMKDSIYIVNNLPYAHVIELGSSKQAPQGMISVTVAEFKREVDKQARRAK